MLKDMFKKADFILLAALIVYGVLSSVALARTGKGGDAAIISVRGHEIGRYPLDQDVTLVVADGKITSELPAGEDVVFEEEPGSYNIVTIKNGAVSVPQANCHSQVCVHNQPISKKGESIICLPHKLIVEIDSSKDGAEYDTIAQ